jgi:predicted HicB family RNase H-like nuclease
MNQWYKNFGLQRTNSINLYHCTNDTEMATTHDSDTRYLGADVPEELHNRVRVQAAKEDKSMAELVREVLDQHVDDL